ncbi:hypothetical protein PV735_31560 [Streptomyces turgidiscabies]|uniref:hypothetical protein n=1 Tax=Streptomyces turgidiscabies TaxID=85558 RepID=UPI0029A7B54D|nr:hypothetical protein [Streptomyces turgidiscabies]MDX3497189.1 hypothetical protein [Streptomyces turgidiscabies]
MAIFPDIRAGQRMVVDVLRSMVYDEVVKSTTETVTNSTTFQDDDELFLPALVNAQYRFDLLLLHSSGTTGDFKMRFTAPAGATVNWGVHNVHVGQTSSTTVTSVSFPSRVLSDQQDMGGGNLAGTTAFISGVLTTAAAAGNLRLQFAQIVSDAAATQVRAGSTLRMKRIA